MVRPRQAPAYIRPRNERGPQGDRMRNSARTRGFTDGDASGKPEFVVGGRQQGTASRPTSARSSRWHRTTALAVAFGAALTIMTLPPNPAGAVDAKKVFNQRC